MKKISVLVGLFIICMTFSTSNLYAACNISGGKIEVSKTGACTSIQTANDKADGLTPLLISVLPGTYTEQITMKPNVTIVGSGQENTKITSSGAATVTGANNSTIENIWVDSTNATSIDNRVSSIINNNATMTVNKVKVTMNVPTGSMEACGIRGNGVDGKFVITNSQIVSVNTIGARSTLGICSNNSNVTVSNVTIDVDSSGGPSHLWNAGIWGAGEVRDSIINVAGARYNYGVDGGQISITNSTIKATGTANTDYNIAVGGSGDTVTNSKIIADGNANVSNTINDSASKFGGSMIQGIIDYRYPVRLVNNWDGDFNPIPNQ